MIACGRKRVRRGRGSLTCPELGKRRNVWLSSPDGRAIHTQVLWCGAQRKTRRHTSARPRDRERRGAVPERAERNRKREVASEVREACPVLESLVGFRLQLNA